ncbi:MAG TPA: alkaline phosphatase family protein [Chloroflexota bacterium]
MTAVRRLFAVTAMVLASLLPISRTNRAAAILTQARPYLVLIVLDGFRPDYLTLAPMRHLHQLMASGMTYDRAWVGQLETETPTGHATIVSGLFPRKHGVLGFGWRDPSGQGFSWMPTDLRQLNAGLMERQIESAGVPTISDLLHRQDPSATSVSISGEKYYAADAMGTGADYIVYGQRGATSSTPGLTVSTIGSHAPPQAAHIRDLSVKGPAYPWVQDAFVARLGARLVHVVRPRMLLLNFPGTDIQGHITGGVIAPESMKIVVKGADAALGTVMAAYRKAGIFQQTDWIITADHGMLPNTHHAPIKQMYADVRALKDPALEDDFLGTAGYIYLRRGIDAATDAAALEARHIPYTEGALYRVPEGGGYACRADASSARSFGRSLTRAYLDLCDTFASAGGPDVILPYAEDTFGLQLPDSPHHGNHGGLSWRVQHIPLVMSGPGIRQGYSSFPAQLVDIAPTVERLMGFPVPAGVDGVTLADALVHTTAKDRTLQNSVRPSRQRDTGALMAHSAAQHAATLGGG